MEEYDIEEKEGYKEEWVNHMYTKNLLRGYEKDLETTLHLLLMACESCNDGNIRAALANYRCVQGNIRMLRGK